ncbi:MAG: tetratricopeptide repeat protein [Longimicrobiales bacterium]
MSDDRKQIRQTVARGVSAWEQEEYDEALQVFEGVLEDFPDFADVHNKAGLCLAMMGRPADALGHFDAALKINESYAEAHLNRGIVLNELGRADEARESLGRAESLDTRDSTTFPSDLGNRLAVTHAQLGDIYLVAEFPERAAEHYRRALEVRPRFVDIRTKYAEALIEVGDLTGARTELETILEARPGFVGARVRLGVVLRRLGDDDGAVAAWKAAAHDDPSDMRPRAYLASAGITLPPAERNASAG